MLLGVSDRSHQEEGEFETMPAVLALLHTQRQIARKTGIPFWNTFGAMGGENSMVRYVENNWASKDYTHLSFRGVREIATALLMHYYWKRSFMMKQTKWLINLSVLLALLAITIGRRIFRLPAHRFRMQGMCCPIR